MSGWLPCDGKTYLASEYPELFDLIGFTYGGNGSNSFAVPDLRGKSPLGSQDYGQYLICYSGLDLSACVGTMGELRLLAFPFPSNAARNWLACAGQPQAVNSGYALFSILGTTYGGDGNHTFSLPNLTGRAPLPQCSYVMCINGIYPNVNQPTGQPRDYIGAIRIFCGGTGEGRLLVNHLPCAGQTLVIRQQTAFFSVLGTFYGGDGQQTFQLPNLVGQSPAEVSINPQLTMGSYLICSVGFYPVRS